MCEIWIVKNIIYFGMDHSRDLPKDLTHFENWSIGLLLISTNIEQFATEY